MGRDKSTRPDRVARRWGRTAGITRGHRRKNRVWEQRIRHRARLGTLAAAAVVLGFVPGITSTTPTSADRRTAPVAIGELQEEARARLSGPVRLAGDGAHGPTAVPALVPSPIAVDERPISPPPEVFDAPAARAEPPPSVLRAAGAEPAGGVWAVIIGIDDYPGSNSDLRASVADANDVDAALAAYGVPAERRLVLRNTQATADVIRASLQWLVDRASSEATAVFFYAGHVRKPRTGGEAVVAADGRLVRDYEMGAGLRGLAARHTWISMASCYAGGFTEMLAKGRILTGASGASSLAYENASYGRSYLVEYMVRRAMLHGEAAGSVEQAFAWAVDALRRDHPNRVPVQYDWLDGELRIGTPPPRTPSSPPPPPPSEDESAPNQPQPSNPSNPPEDDDPCLVSWGSLLTCDED